MNIAPAPIRNGWRVVRLGDVAEVAAPLVDPASPPFSDLPQIGGEDIAEGGMLLSTTRTARQKGIKATNYKFATGDILFLKLRPYLRKCIVASFDGLCSTELLPLRVKPDMADREFLRLNLLSEPFSEYCNRVSKGSRMPRIGPRDLLNWSFAIPSLEEQRRIVAALEERHSVLAQASKQLTQSVTEIDSLLNVELGRALESAKDAVPLAACVTEIKNGIGETWADCKVIGATRRGLAPAKEPVGKTPQRYKHATAGTIFYNPMRILLGSIALVDNEADEGVVSPDYVVFHTRPDRMLPRFLYFWLRSQHGAAAILDAAKGAVRARMMFKGLAKIEIPLPSIDEQRRFERVYLACQTLRAKTNAQRDQLSALDTALLRAAFSGAL